MRTIYNTIVFLSYPMSRITESLISLLWFISWLWDCTFGLAGLLYGRGSFAQFSRDMACAARETRRKQKKA